MVPTTPGAVSHRLARGVPFWILGSGGQQQAGWKCLRGGGQKWSGGMASHEQSPLPVPIFQKCVHTWPAPSLKGQMSGTKLIIVKGWRL